MASGAAAGDGHLLRGIFEGCISGADSGISRRPYHKNCKCAMHKSRGGDCAHSPRCFTVSYPIRRSWSEGCLSVMMNNTTAGATPPRPSSPALPQPPPEMARTGTHLVLCIEEDYEAEEIGYGVCFSPKV